MTASSSKIPLNGIVYDRRKGFWQNYYHNLTMPLRCSDDAVNKLKKALITEDELYHSIMAGLNSYKSSSSTGTLSGEGAGLIGTVSFTAYSTAGSHGDRPIAVGAPGVYGDKRIKVAQDGTGVEMR